MRAASQVQRQSRMASTQRGSRDAPSILDRPTGAAESPPERLQVCNRQLGGPGAGVVMAMDAATFGAATGRRNAIEGGAAGGSRIRPGRVASKRADRRPVG